MKFIGIVIFGGFMGVASAQQIEVSPHRKPHTLDATVAYLATKAEAKFDEKKPDSGDRAKAGFGAKEPGTLLGKQGKLVSWYGIVREIPAKPGEPFLIEHKYYDGLNDYHIQLASLYGAGDFKVVAVDPQGSMKHLSLVRVIGTVTTEKNGIPTVKAEYVRVWHLGDFTFMDYGADATNERWKKLRQNVEMIYDPTPDAAYYERLLGK